MTTQLQQCLPLAVLKLKLGNLQVLLLTIVQVATVLTACGIETHVSIICDIGNIIPLQQCLPLAVLKHTFIDKHRYAFNCVLQQCLPLAVLKQPQICHRFQRSQVVATVLTACGIETNALPSIVIFCTSVATVLTACGMRRRVRGSRGAKRR